MVWGRRGVVWEEEEGLSGGGEGGGVVWGMPSGRAVLWCYMNLSGFCHTQLCWYQ